MRFQERLTVAHGAWSLVLPAWVCTCGEELFVRISDRPGAPRRPLSRESERLGQQALRRRLAEIRQHAEAQRRSAASMRDRLRELMAAQATTLAGVVAVDDHGRYVAANPAMCALLGYSETALLGRSVWDVSAPPLPVRREAAWQKFLMAESVEGRWRLRRRTGEIALVRFAAASHVLPGVHVTVMATRALLPFL